MPFGTKVIRAKNLGAWASNVPRHSQAVHTNTRQAITLSALLFSFVCMCIPKTSYSFEFTKRVEIYTTYAPAKIAEAYISPLLKNDESISIYRGKLIVNASPNTHENIQQTLDRLDKPAQNLLISIRNTKRQSSATQEPTYIHYSGSSSDGKLTVNSRSKTLSTANDQRLHQILVAEGDTGYLKGSTDTYKDSPVFTNGFFTTKKVLVRNGEGLYVTTKLKDQFAVVSLSTEESKSTRKGTKNLQATTEITVPLGQWTPLYHQQSGNTNTPLSAASGRRYSIKPTNSQSSTLEILVELAP